MRINHPCFLCAVQLLVGHPGHTLYPSGSGDNRCNSSSSCPLPPFCQRISGVLVRLTTCERLTNSLPRLSLITLSPLKRRDSRSAGSTADLCQYPSRLISWGTRDSIFQVRHGENLKSLLLWMVGIEPTTPKPMVCRRRHLLRN